MFVSQKKKKTTVPAVLESLMAPNIKQNYGLILRDYTNVLLTEDQLIIWVFFESKKRGTFKVSQKKHRCAWGKIV